MRHYQSAHPFRARRRARQTVIDGQPALRVRRRFHQQAIERETIKLAQAGIQAARVGNRRARQEKLGQRRPRAAYKAKSIPSSSACTRPGTRLSSSSMMPASPPGFRCVIQTEGSGRSKLRSAASARGL